MNFSVEIGAQRPDRPRWELALEQQTVLTGIRIDPLPPTANATVRVLLGETVLLEVHSCMLGKSLYVEFDFAAGPLEHLYIEAHENIIDSIDDGVRLTGSVFGRGVS